jgi:hypothetical protein
MSITLMVCRLLILRVASSLLNTFVAFHIFCSPLSKSLISQNRNVYLPHVLFALKLCLLFQRFVQSLADQPHALHDLMKSFMTRLHFGPK